MIVAPKGRPGRDRGSPLRGYDCFSTVFQGFSLAALASPLATLGRPFGATTRSRRLPLPSLPRGVAGAEVAAGDQLGHDAHRNLRHRLRADVVTQRGMHP